MMPSLTAEDLKDLSVTLVGHRRRLLDAIFCARNRNVGAIRRCAKPLFTGRNSDG
jgi:hypothetical protein